MNRCVLPCCSYYGHLSQRFCNINRTYQELFEQCFSKQYALIHRLETNKLRNVARLFAVRAQAFSKPAFLASATVAPHCGCTDVLFPVARAAMSFDHVLDFTSKSDSRWLALIGNVAILYDYVHLLAGQLSWLQDGFCCQI